MADIYLTVLGLKVHLTLLWFHGKGRLPYLFYKICARN